MMKEKKKSIVKRTPRSSHRDDCPLCREYFIPNEVTRKAIFETNGSLTFADAKSAFAFLCHKVGTEMAQGERGCACMH